MNNLVNMSTAVVEADQVPWPEYFAVPLKYLHLLESSSVFSDTLQQKLAHDT